MGGEAEVGRGSRSEAVLLRMAHARLAAKSVADPELPFLNIAEMGILRDVTLEGETVVVAITPTYSGCPAMDVIAIDLQLALEKAGVSPFRIVRVQAPAWTTDWLTDTARRKLAENGIAPPRGTAGKRMLFDDQAVRCPKCESLRTRKISAFSSTACKAHWACIDCCEPFEHFKCH